MAYQLCQYSSLPALVLNCEGQALQINAAFQEYWKVDSEKLLGAEGYNVFNDPAFCQDDLRERLERAFRGVPIQFEPMAYALPDEFWSAAQTNPEPRIISIFAVPFPVEEGGNALFMFYFDETMCSASNRHESRCERLTAVGAAMADLKHEINNPLLLIIGNSQLLLSRADSLPAEVRQKLEKILSSAEKIRGIVQERQNVADLLLANEAVELLEG